MPPIIRSSRFSGSAPARLVAVATGAAASLALLTACSATVGYSATPDIMNKGVADALEKSVGVRPDVDCGKDTIALSENLVVHCDVSDPAEPATHYDSTVTISNIRSDGTFAVDVKVADTAK